MSQTSTFKRPVHCRVPRYRVVDILRVGCVAALKVAGPVLVSGEISISGVWGSDGHLPDRRVSGAHLNPAVTIALWLFACFDGRKVVPFIISQFAGAFCAAALVYGLYYNLFIDFEQTHHMVRGSVESLGLAGIFQRIRIRISNFVQAFALKWSLPLF